MASDSGNETHHRLGGELPPYDEYSGELPLRKGRWSIATIIGLTAATTFGDNPAERTKPRILSRVINSSAWIGGVAVAIFIHDEFKAWLGRRATKGKSPSIVTRATSPTGELQREPNDAREQPRDQTKHWSDDVRNQSPDHSRER